MTNANNRISHIDNAKAIGIMLIMISHIWVSSSIGGGKNYTTFNNIINSFYVPLFFLLSGVFESSSTDFIKYFKRLFKLLRYNLIFAVFGFLAMGVTNNVWALSSCMQGTVIWFLIVLYIITAIFGIIKRCNIYIELIIIVILALFGSWLAYHGHSYHFIGQSCLCLPFYAFGFHFKSIIKEQRFNWIWFCGSLALYVCSMILYKAPQNVALNMITQPIATFYLSALCGSLIVIQLSKLIHWRPLSWYGQHSIIPMCVHMMFVRIIGAYSLANNTLEFLIIATIIIVCSGICIPLFDNKHYKVFK